MTGERADRESALDGIGQGERGRLVHYCARVTGDPDAAEDLAQQTLIAAWRNGHTLYGPEVREGWLFGIARNVCLSWARGRRREASRLVGLDSRKEGAPDLHDRLAGNADLEVELERDDLARLLDRAMGMLPEATRAVLVERYIEESPQAEVAARLGLSEGAVEARLHRGKLALHKVLTTEFRDEAEAYGMVDPDEGGWQETRIWCMECGQYRLIGRFGEDHTELTLRCPSCCEPGTHLAYAVSPNLRDLKAFKPVLSRLMLGGRAYFRDTVTSGIGPCLTCGRPLPLQPGLIGPVSPLLATVTAVHVRCPDCDFSSSVPLTMLALALPEAQRFWRKNPRIRTLPEAAVEAQGCPAIVTTFESVSDSSTLQVVSRRDTFEVLGIYGAPCSDPSKAEAAGEAS